jgi:hypothetical protein
MESIVEKTGLKYGELVAFLYITNGNITGEAALFAHNNICEYPKYLDIIIKMGEYDTRYGDGVKVYLNEGKIEAYTNIIDSFMCNYTKSCDTLMFGFGFNTICILYKRDEFNIPIRFLLQFNTNKDLYNLSALNIRYIPLSMTELRTGQLSINWDMYISSGDISVDDINRYKSLGFKIYHEL